MPRDLFDPQRTPQQVTFMIDNSENSGGRDGPVVIEHEYDDETPASIAVMQAICALENVDPVAASTDLGITLYDHVDPESLDTVLATGTTDGEIVISFELTDHRTYRVEVVDTGRITIHRER